MSAFDVGGEYVEGMLGKCLKYQWFERLLLSDCLHTILALFTFGERTMSDHQMQRVHLTYHAMYTTMCGCFLIRAASQFEALLEPAAAATWAALAAPSGSLSSELGASAAPSALRRSRRRLGTDAVPAAAAASIGAITPNSLAA